MKYFILSTIKVYQIFISPLQVFLSPTVGCKFWPTCSVYTYKAVEKYGTPRGLYIGLKRLLKCNPWN